MVWEVMGIRKRLWPRTTLWPRQRPLPGIGIIPSEGPPALALLSPHWQMQPPGWSGGSGCSRLSRVSFSCLMSHSECSPAEVRSEA